MVYPGSHLYVTFHWTDTRSQEFGQVGLRWGSEETLPDPTTGQAVTNAFGLFWAQTPARISAQLQYTHAKFAIIGPDGKYPADFEPDVYDVTPVPGASAGTARYPLSVACVTSLTTNKVRGRAHRGRLYLPPIEDALASNGLWSGSIVQSRANEIGVCIGSMNTIIGSPAMVMSRVGAGASEIITGVAVGNRPDTMRSRSRSQVEAYSTAGV